MFGYRETLKALRDADKGAEKELRTDLRAAGELVRQDAAGLFAPTDPRSAAGYRVYVRQRGVSVEQSLRKTTGARPKFGTLQMERALLPALYSNEDEVQRRLERSLDKVAARFNRVVPL